MSHPRIKMRAKTPDAEQLATWTDAALQAEYDSLMSAWMERSNRGARQTWRKFNEMDVFYLEMMRRRYGPGAVAEAKAEASNMRRMTLPNGEN